ncbi:hypothetical protein KJ673_03915 [Patescibacteria group bacterium]|nr:hypothetical protein [Patescibacteria group bacterium]MBU4452705.1 hypothetical protein [Patescibacteria group bacterium]MCG2687601.1 hypothetical protein [Candidatus Parcubacteria bacterium]
MASTQLYKCNQCGRGVSLFQRGERETMMCEIIGKAMQQMYCIDCFEKSDIEQGAEVKCAHCGGPRLSIDFILPCGCKDHGELITDEYSVAMF